MGIENGFQESMDYSRKCFVASRSVSAFLWLVLTGTILLMVFLPVDSWNGVWFCLIFGVAYPLVGLAQSALNYRRCPTGCDVSFQDGKLLFVERFDHDEETFAGSRKIAVRLEKCRWRMGYMENLVSCHYHILPFSSFFPWRRVPVLEIVFQAKDLEDGDPTLFSSAPYYVYPLGFTEETRKMWQNFLEEKDVPRLQDRWRWEMLIHGIFLYFGLVFVGWCFPFGSRFFETWGWEFVPFAWFYLLFLIPVMMFYLSCFVTGNTGCRPRKNTITIFTLGLCAALLVDFFQSGIVQKMFQYFT